MCQTLCKKCFEQFTRLCYTLINLIGKLTTHAAHLRVSLITVQMRSVLLVVYLQHMRLRVLFFCLNQGGHHGKQELSWNRKSRNPFVKIRNPVYLFPHYLVPLQYRGSDICWKRRWVSWQRRYWRDFPDYGNRLGPKPILW